MLTRRRLMTIAATCLLAPGAAASSREWTTSAMGAGVRVVLAGSDEVRSRRVFARAEAVLRQVEAHFSLHRDSELTRLNRNGRLPRPSPHFLELCALADTVHTATRGAFDPSVQPLWLARAQGGDEDSARRLIGWPIVRINATEVAHAPGMALTFNGIAQGHAADLLADLLRAEGFGDVLVDAGEIRALGRRPSGGPWRAAIVLPDGQIVKEAGLSNRALATSAPGATLIGAGRPHIIDPGGGGALWRLVSVSATKAAVADALSTAFCLMDRVAIAAALKQFPDAQVEALIA
jgi:thiamine biosynthesis lipoprotein